MAPQENRSATIIPAYRMSSAVNLFFPLIVLIPFVASFATSIELLDARREPEPVARIADQQHGCGAGGRRRWRRQHVVDLEVPVRGERNRARIAFDEWGNGFTNECGEDRDAGRRTGGGQHERSPDGARPWGIREWVPPDSTVESDERVFGLGERQHKREQANCEYSDDSHDVTSW